MSNMLIFGMGYAASHLAERLRARGWDVAGTTRDGRAGSIAFTDERAVYAALQGATHILSSVPPTEGGDPVLARYGEAIALAPATWTGYLSRSEEHTSELQSLMRISYAVFCLKKKKKYTTSSTHADI